MNSLQWSTRHVWCWWTACSDLQGVCDVDEQLAVIYKACVMLMNSLEWSTSASEATALWRYRSFFYIIITRHVWCWWTAWSDLQGMCDVDEQLAVIYKACVMFMNSLEWSTRRVWCLWTAWSDLQGMCDVYEQLAVIYKACVMFMNSLQWSTRRVTLRTWGVQCSVRRSLTTSRNGVDSTSIMSYRCALVPGKRHAYTSVNLH